MTFVLLVAGSNAHGQLGTGDCEDVNTFQACLFHWDGEERPELPPHTIHVERIVGGANHTLLLASTLDGVQELWYSGDNAKGQLGASAPREDTTIFRRLHIEYPHLPGWSIKNVAAAWETSYIVLSDGSRDAILAMGSNERCMLGYDGSDGTHLIDLSALMDGTDFIVRDIVAGPMHVVALLASTAEDHSVAIGWGTARHGQLGEPIGKVWNMPRMIFALPENNPVASIALGNQHTVFKHKDGKVTALGSSRVGQLTGLAEQSDVASVHCTWNGTYITIGDATTLALSAGKNNKGQLGRVTSEPSQPSLEPIDFPPVLLSKATRQIACGSEHVVVLTEDGEVWGWGWNEHGNLGTADREDVPLPTLLWTPNDGRKARGVWAGCGTTFIAVEH